MRYFVPRDGDYLEYEVREENGTIIISANGENYTVDVKQINQEEFHLLLNNRTYLVDVQRKGNIFRISLGGAIFPVEVFTEREKFQREMLRASSGGQRELEIRAPMPGLILKVEVGEGDSIQAGQPLIIMEAMKMENEIRAQVAGKVKQITIKENQTVDKDDLLVVMEE